MADNCKNGTDSEVACEEAARLTAELQEEAASPEDEESCEYHDLPPPPDGGYGWVIVFASFMCNMIVDGIAYTFGVFLGEFVTYFNEGKGKVAWVGSLLSGVYLSAGPIVSALANKYGCRTVCIAGSITACVAFVLSTFSSSVTMLMLTYGVMGGFGFGLIYLPAVVAVGYYFETKRSLATGIAVCGSGFGTFAFAPMATFLLEHMDWKNANYILAGLILNCAIFGALMRPLEYPKKKRMKPLMQRMYEEKRLQLERGSIGGSYFMVQLPDGTMEKRMKLPLNTEPGVHSSLALDQLAAAAQGGLHPVATLPTISESKVADHAETTEPAAAQPDNKPKRRPHRVSESDGLVEPPAKNMPRNASQPAFSTQAQGIPKNGSVPTFDRIRKTSQGERFKPSLAAIKASSRADMGSNNGEVRKNTQLKLSASSVTGSRPNNTDDSDGEFVYMSKSSLSKERPAIVRPMSRKDIFYSGSVTNLREFQSQKSLSHYRNSVISLPKYEKTSRMDVRDGGEDIERGEKYDLCPCLVLPDSFKSALATMLDVSLLKDPVFMMIGISNVFGMAGLYVPFVYLVDAAVLSGINQNSASFLLSIIGITNTFGRVICGYVADFPKVDSLLLNNMCLVVSTIAVALTPFCNSYGAYVVMAIFFGVAVSGYISLTSILLVDLLGLDKLTNAFGLLILFRGAAAIIGSPLAGAVYDATQSYDIPFYMAGFFFLISTITSFMAPLMKRCVKATDAPAYPEEALTPIDEEPAEDLADDDEPITMVPKIVHTAPSPSTEQPQSISEEGKKNVDKEVNQRESVL
ncbi:monocarboxylate transporter 14 isoform X2 [Phlebotomus papatasi]|uniref:monocarboxylate transporter 14 isoform X2 n=1 Tax=Phlebotomus papatasi TaxID=29031 RepID=UPI002483589C|nr:monocarboxylate transporter 14 isoform X2 [Phlebotomus papatasi]